MRGSSHSFESQNRIGTARHRGAREGRGAMAEEDEDWFLRELEKELEDELEDEREEGEWDDADERAAPKTAPVVSVDGGEEVIVISESPVRGEGGQGEGPGGLNRPSFKRPNRKRNRWDAEAGASGSGKSTKDSGGPLLKGPANVIPSLALSRLASSAVAGPSSGAAPGTCPPCPGFLRGLCIRCGKLKPDATLSNAEFARERQAAKGGREQRSISLRYLHSDLEINKEYVRELKEREAERLIAQKKLSLVFDLDHTLLNSSSLKDITRGDLALLEKVVASETTSGNGDAPATTTAAEGGGGDCDGRSLFLLSHIQMWTKLRPYYRTLLVEASKLFDMHVYTMGERGYAEEMVKLLDPDGSFFGDHVVSKNDSTSRSVKDLDVLIGSEKSVLILDDSPHVWHKHRANVLEIERCVAISFLFYGPSPLSLSYSVNEVRK